MTAPTIVDITRAIRNVPDFPKPGIQFKDITPVLADAKLFAASIDLLTQNFKPGQVDAVVGIDARGFIFATHEQDYDLEYGTNTIAIHTDAIHRGSRVLLIDDLLATGGTAAAAAALLEKIGAQVLEINFLIELGFLSGRKKLARYRVRSLIVY
jgi:adenine phosphoribosyltransferase